MAAPTAHPEPRILPNSRTPKVLSLHEQGSTPREIAAVLGMSTQSVYTVLKRYDLTPHRKPTS